MTSSARAVATAQRAADRWNTAHPVGTKVRYWTWIREGEGRAGATRSKAVVLGDTAVVWLTGHAACVALTHVEAITGRRSS